MVKSTIQVVTLAKTKGITYYILPSNVNWAFKMTPLFFGWVYFRSNGFFIRWKLGEVEIKAVW